MWPAIHAEIAARCQAAHSFFTGIAGPAGEPAVMPTPPHELTAKGIIFVQLYAVYEYTVLGVVRCAIAEMKAQSLLINRIRLELLGFALHPELQSATDVKEKDKWKKFLALFLKTESTDVLAVSDDVFPTDGSHFRQSQLELIWALFGITALVVPDPRCYPLFEELNENRNSVAHGRRTAEDVGSGYSKADVFKKLEQTQSLCSYLVTTMQNHCSDPANLSR